MQKSHKTTTYAKSRGEDSNKNNTNHRDYLKQKRDEDSYYPHPEMILIYKLIILKPTYIHPCVP